MSGDQAHDSSSYAQMPVHASTMEQYSTLQVAPNSNWRASENTCPAPQLDSGPSSPEVIPSYDAPEPLYPQDASSSAHPAYHDQQGKLGGYLAVVGDGTEPAKSERRIWGMRKKTLWIVLGVIIAMLLVGVGVGVGVAVAKSHASSTEDVNIQGDTIDNTDTNSAPADSADPLAISAGTKLAATNITDQYGNDNFFLFWQLNNGAIHMGSFNRSIGKWNETALTTHLGVDPSEIMPGTSISASGGFRTFTSFDLHLCWVSIANKVVCWLWRPVSTLPVNMPGIWNRASLSDFYTVSNGSGLATYSRYCMFCSTTPYVFWQGESDIEGTYHDGKEWKSLPSVNPIDSISAKRGTPLAMLPVGINQNVSSLNMFFISGSNIPTTVSNLPAVDDDPTKWHRDTLTGGLVVNEPVSIATFSTSGQDTGSTVSSNKGMGDAHVLIASREKGAQVARIGLQYYSKGSWKVLAGDGNVGDLQECAEMGMLAANQAGRVFCVVRRMPAAQYGETEAAKGGVKIVGFVGDSKFGKFARQGSIVPKNS